MTFDRGNPALGAAVAALLVLGACTDDRSEFITQSGDYVLAFPLDATAATGSPAGLLEIGDFSIGGVDLEQPDPFARESSFFTASASFFECGGACPAFEFPVRSGAADPRLPALQDPDAEVLAAITPTELFGDPFFVGSAGGLDPSTTYFVALERVATEVNGEPDAAVVLLDNDDFGPFRSDPDDPADQLVRLGGAAGTTLGANPYIIGTFDTDAAGEAGLPNFGFEGGGDDAFIETNQPEGFDLPRYNYLVIYLGDPRSGGVPVARGQFGIDLTPAGEPLGVGFAPFPQEPIADRPALVATGCCAAIAGDVTLTARNLALLTSSVYKVWLLNDETGALVSPLARITVLEPDGEGGLVEVETGEDANTFAGGSERTFRVEIDDAAVAAGGGETVGAYTHAFLSIESAVENDAPAESQPVWSRYTDMNGDPDDPFGFELIQTSNLAFGTFHLAEDPEPWIPGGFGTASFLGEEVGESDTFRARFRNLPLPPVGYFYEGYLLAEEGEALSTGALKSIPQEGFISLRDVDVDPSLSTAVRPDLIIEAADLASMSEVGMPAYAFEEYRLMLRPKASGETGPTVAISGVVPDAVRDRAPAQ